jgi:hypothetical protein
MTKENLIAQLEGAKELTSVVNIDNVIALIQSIEPVVVVEKEFKLTPEFAEEIANKIERALDYNSSDLVDLSSAEFELNWDNRIELNRVDVNVYEIMEHVTGALDQLIEEAADDIVELEKGEDDEDDDCGPSEEEIMQSVNDGLGTQTEE